nr:DHHA1 domain-containing protein [Myxococcota bacterium]
GPAIATIPGDAELVRSVAAKLVAAGRDAILCAPEADGATVVVFRAAGSKLDCGAVFRQLAARLGGRGGGKPERAEGRVTGAITDWAAVVADVLDREREPAA